jgi:hypothetical protein
MRKMKDRNLLETEREAPNYFLLIDGRISNITESVF